MKLDEVRIFGPDEFASIVEALGGRRGDGGRGAARKTSAAHQDHHDDQEAVDVQCVVMPRWGRHQDGDTTIVDEREEAECERLVQMWKENKT